MLRDRSTAQKYWFLSPPEQEDGSFWPHVWEFSTGRQIEVAEEIYFSIKRPGQPCDVTFGTYGNIVLLPEVAEVLAQSFCEDIQLIPCQILSWGRAYILNATRLVECIDYGKSVMECDQLGKPRMILDLRLKISPVVDYDAFRIQDWSPNSIVVSDGVKQCFDELGASGACFQPID